ncbi:unnamed protein product, partial [Gongylonema pulchrum]|uniref:GCV_T domain-containing protein n=1 Tax=Gongylonema pulchrum TaxID=637853 RepID=A0A183ESL5_9BILA
MFYNWSYTNRLAGRPTERVSGIYSRLEKEGCFHLFRNGWEVLLFFENFSDFHLKGFTVRGKDAEKFLDYILTNKSPPPGGVSSALMLTRKGNIFSPVELFHHDQFRSEYLLISDPERESRDINWMKRAASELQANVEISGVSEYLASLAIVGPKSRAVLEELTKSDLGFDQSAAKLMRLDAVPVLAVRTTSST